MSGQGGSDSVGSDANGVSQWLGRVLNQLSLTSWMPAGMLVGVGALIVALHMQLSEHPTHGLNVGGAVAALTRNALGTAVVLLAAVILAATITQAFGFAAIRTLEGYWPGTGPAERLLARRTATWLRRRKALDERAIRDWASALEAAKTAMHDRGIEPAVIAAVEDLSTGSESIDSTYAASVIEKARAIQWRWFAPPALLNSAERTARELSEFPVPHRVLPTRLGNILRAREDSLTNDGHDLEGFIMRRYATVEARLLTQHDDFRTRLEMYCTFVPVFLVLAVLALALLTWPGEQYLFAGIAALLLAALSLLSYRAAIASARGYSAVLAAISAYPEARSSGA